MPAGFKGFRCVCLVGCNKNGPALSRAIDVFRASNPAFVGEGLKPHCLNQSANESGIIIRADSSTHATIPFIVANLLSQSLTSSELFSLELCRKLKRAHLPFLPRVHYVDALFFLYVERFFRQFSESRNQNIQ